MNGPTVCEEQAVGFCLLRGAGQHTEIPGTVNRPPTVPATRGRLRGKSHWGR